MWDGRAVAVNTANEVLSGGPVKRGVAATHNKATAVKMPEEGGNLGLTILGEINGLS